MQAVVRLETTTLFSMRRIQTIAKHLISHSPHLKGRTQFKKKPEDNITFNRIYQIKCT